ncbi:MAG: hypothetical protein [Olavius algarvensis Gamma 1 endosymbiont]|nr:MAG: hypothetical protein [Olavius algarvensis Gamma 1 endosymbiont]
MSTNFLSTKGTKKHERKNRSLVVVIFEVIPSQQWAIIRYYIGV